MGESDTSVCVHAQKVGVGSDAVAVHTPHQWSFGFRKQARPPAAPPPTGSSASLSFESDVWALVKAASTIGHPQHRDWWWRMWNSACHCLSPFPAHLFLPDCLSSKFLSQLSMQRQFYMSCLISSHNYCSYPIDNSLFLPFLVILLLWSALTDSKATWEVDNNVNVSPLPKQRLKANKKRNCCMLIQGTVLLGNVINLNLD